LGDRIIGKNFAAVLHVKAPNFGRDSWSSGLQPRRL
jgi:hypothetical protein